MQYYNVPSRCLIHHENMCSIPHGEMCSIPREVMGSILYWNMGLTVYGAQDGGIRGTGPELAFTGYPLHQHSLCDKSDWHIFVQLFQAEMPFFPLFLVLEVPAVSREICTRSLESCWVASVYIYRMTSFPCECTYLSCLCHISSLIMCFGRYILYFHRKVHWWFFRRWVQLAAHFRSVIFMDIVGFTAVRHKSRSPAWFWCCHLSKSLQGK